MSMYEKPLTVLVTEKRYATDRILPIARDIWPDYDVGAVETMYLGCYEFEYPHGLRFLDVPVVHNPRWKLRQGVKNPAPFLQAAERIICATDPDPSGAIAFHTLIREALGEEASTKAYPVMRLGTYDPGAVSKALRELGDTLDAMFVAHCHAGLARKFFDYSFNINAMMLFGQVLRACGGHVSAQFGMSKYSLQLLYFLRQRPLMSESAVMMAMRSWAGTGRYPVTNMGSPASQNQILVNLISLGLLDSGRTPGARYRTVTVSPVGEAFLDHLHPDCEDVDLPHRMKQWEAGWPNSRPSIEQYLKTFFGKQKRFASLRNVARNG
jgi:hypothetical protein